MACECCLQGFLDYISSLHTHSRPGFGACGALQIKAFSLLNCLQQLSFPIHFFLPPVNSGGTVRAVFTPVGLRDEHSSALYTTFQISVLVTLRFQRSLQRQDRSAEPLAADGECNHLRTDAGVSIVQHRRISAVVVEYFRRIRQLALCCSSSPHKALRLCGDLDNSGVFRHWCACPLWSWCPEARSRRTSPDGIFLFRQALGLQGICPSMSYPQFIIFDCLCRISIR